MELVSIIVPIYNVELYLVRCLKSLINQSYKNIEIILVNDGSTDRSLEICENFSEDPRVTIINKTNGGLSDARNAGIEKAKGEYILFVDSDDYIEKNSVEILYNCAIKNDLDIVAANAIKEIDNEKKKLVFIDIPEKKIFSGKEYMYYRIEKGQFSAAVWLNLYKSKLIKDNNIYFPKGYLHEDENWLPKILLNTNKIEYINFPFYHYIIRNNSITSSKEKSKHIDDLLKTCKELHGIYVNSDLEKKYTNSFIDYIIRIYMSTSKLGKYNKSYCEKIDKKFVVKNAKKIGTKIKAFIFCISPLLYRNIKRSKG